MITFIDSLIKWVSQEQNLFCMRICDYAAQTAYVIDVPAVYLCGNSILAVVLADVNVGR